jgi:enamine deaminase RidA (YjgF/YER057c/UK114 family)
MYSHVAIGKGSEVVVVAGQVGIGGDGKLAGNDMYSQALVAFRNIEAALTACRCKMSDVIRFQTFIVGADNIPEFMRARGEVLPRLYPDGGYPPNTLLVVSRLVQPELLVEIEAMATR